MTYIVYNRRRWIQATKAAPKCLQENNFAIRGYFSRVWWSSEPIATLRG